jgi:hypothetical protein
VVLSTRPVSALRVRAAHSVRSPVRLRAHRALPVSTALHWTVGSARLSRRFLLQLVPPRQCQRHMCGRHLLPGGHGQCNRRRPVHHRVLLRGRRRSRGVRGGCIQRGRPVGVHTVSARHVLQVCDIGQLHTVRRGTDVGRPGSVLHEYVCMITVIINNCVFAHFHFIVALLFVKLRRHSNNSMRSTLCRTQTMRFCDSFGLDPNATVSVVCPAGCASAAIPVYGCSNAYSLTSSVCKAAIHAGANV